MPDLSDNGHNQSKFTRVNRMSEKPQGGISASSVVLEAQAMVDELSGDDPVFLPSEFWKELNKKNLAMLQEDGFGACKRTVSQNYFNWMISAPSHPYFRRIFRDWIAHPALLPLLSRIEKNVTVRLTNQDRPVSLTSIQKQTYKFFVCLTWEKMRRLDALRLSDQVAEPAAGDPIRIKMGGRLISQDIANSVMEANVMLPLAKSARPRFAEIGAGYGRLAHLVASVRPSLYCVFDIPPALQVSHWYLQETLPQKRVFAFRRFEKFSDIEQELEEADIAFFTSNQLRHFPDCWFDVSSTISTLPEMSSAQVEVFLRLMQRTTNGHIFLKQWKSWVNDRDNTLLTKDSYVFPEPWRLTMDREDPLIPDFFNAVWSR